jgi:hypothetical protein
MRQARHVDPGWQLEISHRFRAHLPQQFPTPREVPREEQRQ